MREVDTPAAQAEGPGSSMLVPTAARLAGLEVFSRLQGMVSPWVLVSEMCRAIAAELIKAGRVELAPPPLPEVSVCTFGGKEQPSDPQLRMVRLGATPSEVFGTTGRSANDKVLPDAPSYRRSANMPFGRPQAHLREWQHEIDSVLAQHHRTMRSGEDAGGAPP